MHELGMCEGVVAAIERRAQGRPVSAVGVRAGSRLRVVPDAFDHSFEMVAAGTVAAGAEVELEIVPVRATCQECDTTFTTDDPVPACPKCDGVRLDTEGGQELTLVWLRYDEDEGTA